MSSRDIVRVKVVGVSDQSGTVGWESGYFAKWGSAGHSWVLQSDELFSAVVQRMWLVTSRFLI